MCFATVGKAIFGHPEVAIGLIPGGGATQRLPRLIGRGRALEVLLGCNDLSAELAERYGYINRALPADELTPFIGLLVEAHERSEERRVGKECRSRGSTDH